MALHTLGTNSTTSLRAIKFTQDVSDSDMAAIASTIVGDGMVQAQITAGFQRTGTITATSTSITGLSSTTGLAIGMRVIGVGLAGGTKMVNLVGSTATIYPAALGNGTNMIFLPRNLGFGVDFSRQGILRIPGRALDMQVLPGDVIAVDPLSGQVIVLPVAALNATGSLWTYT